MDKREANRVLLMDDATQKEIKQKLRQLRSESTRAQKLVAELDKYYHDFENTRAKLDDENDGLEANLNWSRTKKDDIDAVVADVNEKTSTLDATLQSIDDKTADINASFASFNTAVGPALDPNEGAEALHNEIRSLRDSATALNQSIQELASTASTNSDRSDAIRSNIEDQFKEFKNLMKKVNAPKNGIDASLDRIQRALDIITEARTQAQSELGVVTSLKDQGASLVEEITNDRATVKGLQKESQNLTEDIRNTLGLTSSKSLSASFGAKSADLDKSLNSWGKAVTASIALLILAIGAIFYIVYLKNDTSPSLTSVVAKILFSSPFVFAVYFTVTNYNHARNLRDKYSFKETIAKSLQAYIKLLRTEFEDTANGNKEYYRQRRLNFSLDNMETIYKEPMVDPVKRKYAFGLNKFFNVSVEEEDARTLEKRVADTVTEFVEEQSIQAEEKVEAEKENDG